MILNWENEFSEKLVIEGIDLEDDVSQMSRTMNYLSGFVCEKGKNSFVGIELNDDFKIENLECDCGKKKCHHMTALIHASELEFKSDIDYGMMVDNINDDKVIDFIKSELDYNEDLLDEFKDKFIKDILDEDDFPLDDKLFLILDYYDWTSLITDYVKNDLMKLYEDGYYDETFYLISVMFNKVIDRYTYDSQSNLKECYFIICVLIKKLSKDRPELIKQFLKHCKDHNYLNVYPKFRKLYSNLK